ncbi:MULTISPECIES: GMC family oxidoreductase [Thioclava]|uniref:GMC family oxidoreductase n=1 Tax=Thioclava TaxID=285107 RepID=UPI000C669744|nr:MULTISPECIES: GMC family oxidoreductase [Thioclava]MAQ36658.1 choline dehydrogenase [Thioclava sp.]
MADFDADVIVVGSGSLGGLAAQQIAQAGHSVIVLEAGPDIPDWKVTENWRNSPRKNNFNDPFGDVPYAPNSFTPGYVDPHLTGGLEVFPGTLRVLGGTSRHWTAATWRLLPEDMAMHSTYGIAEDWPISYDDLEPFYTQAEYEIGVNGQKGFDESGLGKGETYPPRSKPYPLPPEAKPYATQRLQQQVASMGFRVDIAPSSRLSQPYDNRPACIGNNICNWNCPIGAKHSGYHVVQKIRDLGVEIRTQAIVDKIETGDKGKITALSYINPEGDRTRLTAKMFVIAAHGYETPKLLLMNDLANSSDMVGRRLMIHPTIDMTWLSPEPYWTGRGQNIHGAIMQRRALPDRDKVPSTRYDLLNAPPEEGIAQGLLKDGTLGPELDAKIRDHSARVFTAEALTEDLPDPANRIEVNPSWKDAVGLPGIKLTYKLSDYTKANLPRLMEDYARFLQATGGTRVSAPEKFICQQHVMGTTVMGSKAEEAVCDADLRCFDHENLFLVTTGVMPTAGGVNPTLTGMALAIRAGQTIAKEL